MRRMKQNAIKLLFGLFAVAVAMCQFMPSVALAAVPTERFDPQKFYDGVSYVTRNPNAPLPSLPWANGGTADIIEMVGCHITDDYKFQSDNTSHNNGALGMKVTVRFPQEGIYHDAVTGEEFIVDIYDTFEVLQSIGTVDDHVEWYCGNTYTGHLLLDGWWIRYSPLYKDTYVFRKSDTNEVVQIHSIGYTERSMNAGEGFALEGAVRGFVTDDMPDWAATTTDGEYFKSSHLPGTNVMGADIEGRNAHGFVGALMTSIGPGHTCTNYISPKVSYASGPLAGEWICGTDASGVVRSVIDDVTYDDTSMWMGASMVGSASSNSVPVYGMKLEFEGAGYLNNGWNGITSQFFSDADRKGGSYTSTTEWWNSYVGRWYVPSFAPFTATTPPPPTKQVDKVNAYGTESVRYTIRQQICNEGIDSAVGYTYSSMSFVDTVDNDMTYNNDLVVTDTHGTNVTSRGTVSVSGQTITWPASAALLEELDYNGGYMTFTFTASTTSIADDWKYENKGRININRQGQDTNIVTTNLLSGPLPKVEKRDYNRHNTTPQGDATTTGASFTVRYWFAARSSTECLSKTPTRTWVFKSSDGPVLVMDAAHKVSGDALFTLNGNVVVPLHGYLSVTENAAPTGYRLNPATQWYDLG